MVGKAWWRAGVDKRVMAGTHRGDLGAQQRQDATQQQREAMPSKAHLQHPTFSSQAPNPPDTTTSWGTSVQTHEPMRDIYIKKGICLIFFFF